MTLDPLILSRVQFVWVIGWHILLPAFTIGLGAAPERYLRADANCREANHSGRDAFNRRVLRRARQRIGSWRHRRAATPTRRKQAEE
jgi:hypothetical protein